MGKSSKRLTVRIGVTIFINNRLQFYCTATLVIFFSLFLPSRNSKASEIIILNDTSTHAIDSRFQIFEDRTGMLGVEQIIELAHQGHFIPADPSDLVQRRVFSTFWLRLNIRNDTELRDWILHPLNPYLKVQAYKSNTIEWDELDFDPAHEQRFDSTRLNLTAGHTTAVYLKVSAPYVVDMRFELIPENLYYQRTRTELILISIGCGVFIALIVYNLFLYLSLRDADHLFYLLFALVNCHMGLIAIRLPTNILELGGVDWLDFIFSYRALAPLTTILFARSFLLTRNKNQLLDRLLQVYSYGLLAFIAYFILLDRANSTAIMVQDFYFMLGAILLITTGIASLKKGFQPAIYFLLGMGTFIVGTFLYLAGSQGLISARSWTYYGTFGGQVIQMILMSLALADKIRRMERNLAESRAMAAFKSRLLRLISHDIANPLTVIRGTSQIMQKHPEISHYLDRQLRSVNKIHEIMSFVLKSEKLEDETELELRPVLLQEVFDDLQFLFEERVKEKNIQITFSLSDSSLAVMAEKTSLTHEVLGNLISNAIKFSHPGGVVQAKAFRNQKIGGKIMIQIIDQGVGMSAELINKIFDHKQTVTRPGTLGEKGHGYGLALVQSYIRAYRGELKVISRTSSNSQSGTTWIVILPLG